MAFYSKEATLLVYDQVNRDNPDLPSPLTPSNSVITKAAAAVSSNGRNTRATFTRLPGSGMQGSITVYYDRINLTKLFDFSPLVYFPDTVTTQAAALPYINEALGLSLTAADITSPTGNVPKPNAGIKTVTLTIATGNPAFLGTLAVRYLVTAVGYYPNSGPGPKYLRVGNTAMGYFGLIQGSDFITRQQVCDRAFLKTKVTAVTAGDDVWAKFFYQGKVIYFPTKYIVAGIRWADVYNEGLVYGTNDNGFIPMSPTANQYRIITADTNEGRVYLSPRLPKYSLTDPNNMKGTQSELTGAEFEMFKMLVNDTWAADVLYPNVYVMTATTYNASNNTYYVTSYNNHQSVYNILKTAVNNSAFWWPVLELVDPTTVLLGLEDVLGDVENTLQPVPFTTGNDLRAAPVIFGLPKTVDFTPIPVSFEQPFRLSVLTPYSPKTVDYTPISFTAELYTPPPKTSLASLDGELGEFK